MAVKKTFQILPILATFALFGCSSTNNGSIDEALRPFADVDFELKTEVSPKVIREEHNLEMAQYLMYVGGVIREQGTVAAALEASDGKLSEFATNESAQTAVAAAWDRANQRMVEFIRSSDQFKGQKVGQEGGPDLDAQTALIDVVSQPISRSSVLEMVKDRTRLRDDQWSDISDTLKKRLGKETLTNLVQAQEKYSIRDHFSDGSN